MQAKKLKASISKLEIIENMCLYFELHLDKYPKNIEYLLDHSFDKSSCQSEILISINDVTRCCKCLSDSNLCWFHSEAVKTILINDAKKWLDELKTKNYP